MRGETVTDLYVILYPNRSTKKVTYRSFNTLSWYSLQENVAFDSKEKESKNRIWCGRTELGCVFCVNGHFVLLPNCLGMMSRSLFSNHNWARMTERGRSEISSRVCYKYIDPFSKLHVYVVYSQSLSEPRIISSPSISPVSSFIHHLPLSYTMTSFTTLPHHSFATQAPCQAMSWSMADIFCSVFPDILWYTALFHLKFRILTYSLCRIFILVIIISSNMDSHPFSKRVILSEAKLGLFFLGLSPPESECGPLSATCFPESLDQNCLNKKKWLFIQIIISNANSVSGILFV